MNHLKLKNNENKSTAGHYKNRFQPIKFCLYNKETGSNTMEPVSTYKILLSMELNKTLLQK